MLAKARREPADAGDRQGRSGAGFDEFSSEIRA